MERNPDIYGSGKTDGGVRKENSFDAQTSSVLSSLRDRTAEPNRIVFRSRPNDEIIIHF